VRQDDVETQEEGSSKITRQSKKITKGEKNSHHGHDDTGKGGFTDAAGVHHQSATEANQDKIFNNLKELDQDYVDKRNFLQRFHDMGILADDDRLKDIVERLDCIDSKKLTKEQLNEVIQESLGIVEKTLSEDFIIP
jgi:hypothetical protein